MTYSAPITVDIEYTRGHHRVIRKGLPIGHMLIMKSGKYYLKHNSFTDDMPVVVAFKAMGIHTDQEIVQLVGSEKDILSNFAPSLGECAYLKIFTQLQALEYIGSKTRINRTWGKPKSKVDEACDVLMGVILVHVPV